jgi:hypothetical protein
MFVTQDEGNRKIVLDSSLKMTSSFVAAASALGGNPLNCVRGARSPAIAVSCSKSGQELGDKV